MQPILDFINAHQVAVGALVMAILNLVVELNPKVQSNSIFTLAYNFLKDLFTKKP